MPTYYLDYENGNDSADGSTFALGGLPTVGPWKTLTTGATAARIAPGDIIKIAKSPAPYSIGTGSWTNLSKLVTITSASQTALLNDCELGWTANPSGDATVSRLGVATDAKEGSYCNRLAMDSSVQTNIMQASGSVSIQASGSNLSAYQKISFWFKNQNTAIQNGTLLIKLCDDTAGNSPVDTFTIPSIPSINTWLPITLARDGGGNCGSAIKSITFYTGSWVTGLASNNLWIDDFIACTTNGLNLQSLISKNSAEQGGTESWYGIQSINGSSILLDNETSTKANAGRGYSGTTESVTTYARETIKTALAATISTVVQEVMDSGTLAGGNIQFQGGYDTGTGNQTGETFFDGLNGNGYGVQVSTKSFTTLNYINASRYTRGILFTSSNNNTITTVTGANNNGTYGIYFVSSNNNTITTVTGANNNGNYGIYFSNNSNNNTITTVTGANNNSTYGIYFSNVHNNTITTVTGANNNGNYGIGFVNVNNNTITTITTTGNVLSGIYTEGGGWNYINSASIAEGTKINHYTSYSETRVFIETISGYARIDCRGSNIVEQAATAGGTGNEWKISVTDTERASNFPLKFKIAEVACIANEQVTVTLYFKKSHATDIAAKLITPGNELAGVSETSTTCPSDTSRNQVQIQFTPTETGVVAIEAWVWWNSGVADENVICDDLNVSQ